MAFDAAIMKCVYCLQLRSKSTECKVIHTYVLSIMQELTSNVKTEYSKQIYNRFIIKALARPWLS